MQYNDDCGIIFTKMKMHPLNIKFIQNVYLRFFLTNKKAFT